MASLRVKDQGNGPVIYGRWRDASGKNVERPIGRGWLVAEGQPGAKPGARQTIGKWRERRGRPAEGFLSIQEAIQRLPQVQEAYRVEVERAEAQKRREQREGLSLADAMERFVAWGIAGDPHSGREPWKDSYARNTRTYLQRLVTELGPERRVDEVQAEEVQRFFRKLVPMRNGKPTGAKLTPKFLKNYRDPAALMFSYLQAQGWVEADPTQGLPSYKPKAKRSDDPLRQHEYLTPAQVRAAAEHLNAQDRAMVLLMALTGARPGEAVALRWENVDHQGATIRLVESRTMGTVGTPKSGSGRTVPMAPEVSQALAKLSLRGLQVGGADPVFIGARGGYVDQAALRERFYAAQDAAGITPRRELRQLRNTFGTVMASTGELSMRELQQLMGHGTITQTERYASFMPRHGAAGTVQRAFALGALENVAADAQAEA